MYSTVLLASLVYVAIGRSLTGWRIATGLLALSLAYEGTRLIFVGGRELPDPRRARQPGLHQPVRASWIVASAGASRVLTLWVASLMSRVGEEHHGTALLWSAALVVVAAGGRPECRSSPTTATYAVTSPAAA